MTKKVNIKSAGYHECYSEACSKEEYDADIWDFIIHEDGTKTWKLKKKKVKKDG